MLEVDIAGSAGDQELQIELNTDRGECLALAGPSGAGKTTLLRMIAGLARPRHGRIVLGGRTLFDAERGVDVPPELRRCGCVFQDYALFTHLPAWRNVAYAVRGPRRERRARALELLERLDASELADVRPGELSGGERQRVALARAIASEPELLLFDEPLGALDVRNRALAAQEISSAVAGLDVPALLVTHDFLEAALLGQRVAVLDGGRIVQRGPAAELTATPLTPFVADLTGANVLRGRATPQDDGLTAVTLTGGGQILSTDTASGDVAVSVPPWEIVLTAPGLRRASSERNHLEATVTAVTSVANRTRVGLSLPEPLVAEVSARALSELGLKVGDAVVASLKASALRLFELADEPATTSSRRA